MSVNVAIVGLGFGAEFIPIYKNHPQANDHQHSTERPSHGHRVDAECEFAADVSADDDSEREKGGLRHVDVASLEIAVRAKNENGERQRKDLSAQGRAKIA